jgi:hypothetical protein
MPVPRVRRLRGDAPREAKPSTAREPCVQCDEETAVGSVFFSDRLVVERTEGGRAFLCSACYTRARAAKMGEPLNEADLRRIADNGLMIGVGLLGPGPV